MRWRSLDFDVSTAPPGPLPAGRGEMGSLPLCVCRGCEKNGMVSVTVATGRTLTPPNTATLEISHKRRGAFHQKFRTQRYIDTDSRAVKNETDTYILGSFARQPSRAQFDSFKWWSPLWTVG